jgi:predicted enzyme related to lactoylglutathione lyase
MDECLRVVAEEGTQMSVSPMPIPGDEAYAAFFDTEGNMIGVIAPINTASGVEPMAVEA